MGSSETAHVGQYAKVIIDAQSRFEDSESRIDAHGDEQKDDGKTNSMLYDVTLLKTRRIREIGFNTRGWFHRTNQLRSHGF